MCLTLSFLNTLYRNLGTIGVAVDLILLFCELRVEQDSLLTGNWQYESWIIYIFDKDLNIIALSITLFIRANVLYVLKPRNFISDIKEWW